MALRLLFLSTHYRSEMNFTWENLAGAQTAWQSLSTKITQFKHETDRTVISEEKVNRIAEYRQRFFGYLEDDLRTSEALAVMWEVLKSSIPSIDKYDLLVEFDVVLGLGLSKLADQPLNTLEVKKEDLPPDVQQLLNERDQARIDKNWDASDQLRDEIAKRGFKVLDQAGGMKILKLS